jgi:NhaP-type Na+/H+ or K+/H+ antiporter
VALVVAVFSAGLKLDRALRWGEWGTTRRLIVIAMPLTIAGVAALGGWLLGLSTGAALVLGAALAPTDPVLAGDIGVGPPGDEDEHEPNFGLTSEAALNDGLAAPFLLAGLLIAAGGDGWTEWLGADVVYAIGLAVPVGAGMGLVAAWSVKRLRDRDLLAREFDGWHAIAAALVTYGAAQGLDANGLVAVFAAGLVFRRYERDHEVNASVHHGAEVVEKFLELAVILLLGSILTFDGLGTPGIEGWLLAVTLLIAVRPLACVIALAGSRLDGPHERAFVSWFGVRGVGTLYYVAVAVGAGVLAPAEERLIVWTAVACVLVSIAVHGITGGPALRRLTRRRAPEPASSRAR